MSRTYDLAVVGAGPAGLGAACKAREYGLSVLVIDEQHAPGGQIYRDVEKNIGDGDRIGGILGPDYLRGRELVEAFRRSGAEYLPGAAVWRVDTDGVLWISREGRTEQIRFRRLILATGAMERPVTVPGWPLPGVLGAGGAQV
jgi:NADPH-dependent 2,4-dienoyl-CoA reductase/sulfur reductase-like enzyme